MKTDPQAAEHVSADAADADAAADERERRADERERRADERERLADAREDRLTAWEDRLDDQARGRGRSTPSLRQRSYEAIERARGRVESSLDRLDRSEAALRRADARDDREQRIVEGETADSWTRQTREGPAPREVLEARAHRLHRRFTAVAFALGAAQDALAGEYERLALEQPEQAAEYRRRAERAYRTVAALRAVELAGDQDGGRE